MHAQHAETIKGNRMCFNFEMLVTDVFVLRHVCLDMSNRQQSVALSPVYFFYSFMQAEDN